VLLEVEAEHERSYDAADVLEAAADAKNQHKELAGGVDVIPARVLDPMSKPNIIQLNNAWHKVHHTWTKLPPSWNPKIKEETAEEKWNREYPEPK